MKIDFKIDFVVLWVDDKDTEWKKEKAKYQIQEESLNGDDRYNELGLFKYWFRGVEKYAPWVNKVYLITCGHVPKWLNLDHEKLVHIKHEDYIPKEYLPTFNSNVIELHIHRIKNLSEHFVLFNDDLYLNAPTTKEDFFENGLPKDYGIRSFVSPTGLFNHIIFNNVSIINKHFTKKRLNKNDFSYKYGLKQFQTLYTLPFDYITGYYNAHLTGSLLKSTYHKVWGKEGQLLHKISENRFRSSNDLSQWLMRYWQIEEGNFSPQDIHFGKLLQFNNLPLIMKKMEEEKLKVLCLNDNLTEKNGLKTIKSLFEKKFPNKSDYEK
ncbi:hypothetical protein D920_00049 [Enterococcus faecalis 13-SD-W-01]|nr:hypothetical protein D920_00049 [Enterococcus faecalis 13-SD-W-01]